MTAILPSFGQCVQPACVDLLAVMCRMRTNQEPISIYNVIPWWRKYSTYTNQSRIIKECVCAGLLTQLILQKLSCLNYFASSGQLSTCIRGWRVSSAILPFWAVFLTLPISYHSVETSLEWLDCGHFSRAIIMGETCSLSSHVDSHSPS